MWKWVWILQQSTFSDAFSFSLFSHYSLVSYCTLYMSIREAVEIGWRVEGKQFYEHGSKFSACHSIYIKNVQKIVPCKSVYLTCLKNAYSCNIVLGLRKTGEEYFDYENCKCEQHRYKQSGPTHKGGLKFVPSQMCFSVRNDIVSENLDKKRRFGFAWKITYSNGTFKLLNCKVEHLGSSFNFLNWTKGQVLLEN
jgi:hypothetical protein